MPRTCPKGVQSPFPASEPRGHDGPPLHVDATPDPDDPESTGRIEQQTHPATSTVTIALRREHRADMDCMVTLWSMTSKI